MPQCHYRPLVLRAAFDIAIQPKATAYASPLKLFEYLALGRAVVAPDQPNLREALEDGRNTCLFAPDDPESLKAVPRSPRAILPGTETLPRSSPRFGAPLPQVLSAVKSLKGSAQQP